MEMPMMADTWDDQHTRATSAIASGSMRSSKPKVSKNIVVPDDWELDDEEEEDVGRSVDLRNKQLWEDANEKVHHPMPSLIISRGTSSTSVALPSLPLNQPPPMRILKRPSPSLSPEASTNSGNATGETLKEREARYHAARERIFGVSPTEVSTQVESDDKKPSRNVVSPPHSPSPTVSVKFVREPRGPGENGGSNPDTKGFGERKAKRPLATTISPTD